MWTRILSAGAAVALLALPVNAQNRPTTGAVTKADCERNSKDPDCTRLQTPGTTSAPDNSTLSPGAGKGAAVGGGGKAGGVTPQGNPATAGGGPRSSQ